MSKSQLKEVFEVESKHSAFYTEGNVEWHENDLYCYASTHISVFDTEKGLVSLKLAEEEEIPDTIHTFTKNEDKLVTCHRSGLLKLWTLSGDLVKQWRCLHKGPIARLNLKGATLLSGGSDGVIRVWNLEFQVCRLALKGCFGVVNVVEFHPINNQIFASGDDGKINLFDLESGGLIKIFSGHFAKVTSLSFHCDNEHFVSSGRDKTIILWNINSEKGLKTIPIGETIESVICLPRKFKIPNFKCNKDIEEVFVITGGDRGVIRVWNMNNCKEIYVQENSLVNPSNDLAIFKVIFNEKLKQFSVITGDRNIIIYDLKTFNCIKQFVGFSDEILDIIYLGTNDQYLIVATNSIDIKFYENSTMNCRLLKGHTDLVLSLNKSRANPNLFVSSAKDNSIRVWVLNEEIPICIGVGTRHTASVTTIALTSTFIVSGSEDTCLKIWDIPQKNSNTTLNCQITEAAHQKCINSVAISPNDKIIASASQDKTVKLWSSDNLGFLGSLKGHKRGVWSVRFSPIDQVLLSSSADCSIKLWSIAELNCLKTFEGHDSSVLRIEFLSHGMQFLSSGSDGLLKLFNIKTSETVATFDEHSGRIWALAVKKDESQLITGGADSLLLKWKDVTEEKRLEKLKEQEEFALQEQQLMNCMQNEQFLKALKLALRLNKPFQVLKIVENVIKKGESGLSDAVMELNDEQKEQLLKVAANWNTNSRFCQPAQLVLNVLLNELQSGRFKPVGLGRVLEGILPYTERHFNRLTQMMQDLHFITYTINCMQPYAKSM
nr:transducin beta-like protein 3 [Onthophagus taurus]